MDYSQLTSPRAVKKLMRDYEIRFKKRFGQNFLVDRNILNKIIDSAELKPDHYVLEIGTGLGTLTYALAEQCRRVITFEIDHDLVQIFRENQSAANVQLIAGDALKYDWREVLLESGWQDERVSLVANLPYYLTSPLIMKALESGLPFESIVVMVQKEVADRMQAEPGTKDYGLLTLAVGYYADVEIVTKVPRTVFIPAPDVDSAVVKLTPHPVHGEADRKALFAVMRAAFAQRRKTLKNNLKDLIKEWGTAPEEFDRILAELDLPKDVRGESLSLKQFIELTLKLTAEHR
ncbi:MAG: 16S rRNA (adenine(1518)-N(6)/adenine(1519)-N(6))-dimethyltransferase RsmA [Candidatus Wallacebacter cryptica]|nr:16S rRNA (adenine(1518)-N(6)/adenine(1519)-N(6))-dimethyltransferase RsmA [Bacillota bacterium]